ncbi:MAG TPA: HNH endonuclease signature motif containing protein, partial [Polyangiales bacterium]|nr:HNH endonuclease signature motif containing protein [Polyangiales bacterium]
PGGDLAEIVERACDVLLDKTLKQRCAQVSRPRSSIAKDAAPQRAAADAERVPASGPDDVKRSRYIPRAVLREVFARDGGQCTYVGPSDHRCEERGMLEVHHVHAFARGGEPTVENLRLVCRSHNNFYAVQDFGAAHMKSAASKKQINQGLLFAS